MIACCTGRTHRKDQVNIDVSMIDIVVSNCPNALIYDIYLLHGRKIYLASPKTGNVMLKYESFFLYRNQDLQGIETLFVQFMIIYSQERTAAVMKPNK